MPATRVPGAVLVGQRAGEAEDDQTAAGYERRRQTVSAHFDGGLAPQRALGDGGQRIELDA